MIEVMVYRKRTYIYFYVTEKGLVNPKRLAVLTIKVCKYTFKYTLIYIYIYMASQFSFFLLKTKLVSWRYFSVFKSPYPFALSLSMLWQEQCSPYIMCVQYIGECSVHRGMFSTSGGYHEYIGGIS